MPTNNIIVDTLPAYVEQRRLPLLGKVIFKGGTIRNMAKQTGIKTKAAINYVNTDPTFQAGGDCGFNPLGTASLTQRQIETGQIKVNMEFCAKNVLGTWAEYQIRINARENRLPFEEEFIGDIIANIQKKMDKAVWQGDTTSTDADLKQFDGLLKIAGAEATTVKVDIAAGTSAYDAIEAVYMAIPEEVLDKKARIFVAPALFRQFMQEMVKKNYYHYSGPQDENVREFVFPGSDVLVVSTPGLAGTQNILASYYGNMFYGCDAENDAEKFDLWFEKKDDKFLLKVEWNAGVQFAFPDEVVLATIATATEPTEPTE